MEFLQVLNYNTKGTELEIFARELPSVYYQTYIRFNEDCHIRIIYTSLPSQQCNQSLVMPPHQQLISCIVEKKILSRLLMREKLNEKAPR